MTCHECGNPDQTRHECVEHGNGFWWCFACQEAGPVVDGEPRSKPFACECPEKGHGHRMIAGVGRG